MLHSLTWICNNLFDDNSHHYNSILTNTKKFGQRPPPQKQYTVYILSNTHHYNNCNDICKETLCPSIHYLSAVWIIELKVHETQNKTFLYLSLHSPKLHRRRGLLHSSRQKRTRHHALTQTASFCLIKILMSSVFYSSDIKQKHFWLEMVLIYILIALKNEK